MRRVEENSSVRLIGSAEGTSCKRSDRGVDLGFVFATVRRVAVELSSRELRELKARAQLLKPMLKVGKEGLSPAFLKAADEALSHHSLVKLKFDDFKEQKKELAPKLADQLAARVVMQVGNVVVIFRPKTPTPPPAE